MKNALIIFQKNPELGKVKTRLATTIGEVNALQIYSLLVENTHRVIEEIEAKKYLFFSDFIEKDQKWENYSLKIQDGNDLGLRMYNAILEAKREGAERIIVIGTDCYELTSEIIQQGFQALETSDYCIGPALDGGYYLIGTTNPDEEVFCDKEWSTDQVFNEAKTTIESLSKRLFVLKALSDVDEEKDLGALRNFLS